MPRPDDFEGLPYRALTAIAVRAARRVREIYRSPDGGLLDHAIILATEYASGLLKDTDSNFAATVADRAKRVASDRDPDGVVARVMATQAAALAAQSVQAALLHSPGGAIASAAGAVEASREAVIRIVIAEGAVIGDAEEAADRDLRKVRELKLGLEDSPGEPIDPTEDGPLGFLWPPPIEVQPPGAERRGGSLVLEFEGPEGATDDEILALLGELALRADSLHRTLGGHGLKIERLEIGREAPVTAGVPLG